MSIRLRLTLFYSVILSLALIAFGLVVYGIQNATTLQFEQEQLTRMVSRSLEVRPSVRRPPFPTEPHDLPRGYVQVRSPEGEVLFTETPGDVVLPLSAEGLVAVQGGELWTETAFVGGERLLIVSSPVREDDQLVEIVQAARSLEARDRSIVALARILLVGGALAVLAAFAIGWRLAGMALRPIQHLTETARAIGAERDLSRRVEHSGPNDEVGALATTFNAMLGELQAAYQQVADALQLQRRFVADVSHELRTPLTTLNGNIELLRREPPISAEDRVEVLADMASESARLIRLVNDLLTLARSEARRSLTCEPIEVGPIVEEACRQARTLAPDRVVTCDSPHAVEAVGEPDALKQVLLILLDNAIKHAQGEIHVSTHETRDAVLIRVRDGGPASSPSA